MRGVIGTMPRVRNGGVTATMKHLSFCRAAAQVVAGLACVCARAQTRSPEPDRPAVFSDADVVRFSWVNNTRLMFSVADLETGNGEDR